MSGRHDFRPHLTVETASDVADALSYFLSASAENFGGGWANDPEEAEHDEQELRRQRRNVRAFLDRISARDRMAS